MKRTKIVFALLVCSLGLTVSVLAQDVTKYIRYEHDGVIAHGILEGETIHQLRGNIFESAERTGTTVAINDVNILTPTEPTKVLAAGLNYRSHLGQANPAAVSYTHLQLTTILLV